MEIAEYQAENIYRSQQPTLTAADAITPARQSAKMRRVLFISYSFPPSTEMGAYSCVQIARCLPIYGWRPIVLTIKEKYLEEQCPEPDGEFSPDEPALVVRTSRLPHPLDIYRKIKSSWQTSRAGDRQKALSINGAGNNLASTGKRRAIDTLMSMLNCPDAHIGWLIPAIASGLREIRRTNALAIYSSAPYFTNHLAGYALALLTGLPWVAHFRDPWITGSYADYSPDDPYFKINRRLERMIIGRADAVICVTEEHAAMLRATYDQMPASKFAVVMNGFDGWEWEKAGQALSRGAAPEAGEPRKFRITYAGTLYMKRNPAPLFRALRTLIDAGEMARDEVSVELIGWCESSEEYSVADLISEAGLEGVVSVIGPLNHRDTWSRLSQSDLLLLLAEGLVIQIPGKTFEYLKTYRPILALTSEGALANLLRRTGGGWIVDPNDQMGVVAAVRECYHCWKHRLPGRAPDASLVESFDRRKTTGRIAELLNSFTAQLPPEEGRRAE